MKNTIRGKIVEMDGKSVLVKFNDEDVKELDLQIGDEITVGEIKFLSNNLISA